MLTEVSAAVADAPGAGAGSWRVLKSLKASRRKVAFAGRNMTMREPSPVSPEIHNNCSGQGRAGQRPVGASSPRQGV